jgi:class 3 adenylate cyclase/tetratricopeptide (TPR) repeat protein
MRICPNCGEENPERFRLCGFCGAALAPELPPQEVRKTVTIVFSDLKGSTAMGEKLDSEAVREVMSRYFNEMRAALEQHGGTVEKYIGDAIMAVFGLPRVREDDAVRAVRAALEMRQRLAALNEELESRWGVTVGNRTGVNTGEVVAGDPTTGQRLVTGDTVNTAARLEQAAPTNEVLLGEDTYRLVRHVVEVEPVEPLELKGKSERVPAYRLVAVPSESAVTQASEGASLIGREAELDALTAEFERALSERSCRSITLVADAGVGKSRLVEEFAGTVGGSADVLRGRCLSYGRGITFWPVVEIVRQAAGIREDDSPEQARQRIASILEGGSVDAGEQVAAAVGLSEREFPLDELFWGVRKLLESQARRKPLVVLFEDVHWAEMTLLDLVEHIVTAAADVPLLVLCTARPELDEERPGWRPSPDSVRIELHALSTEQTALVVQGLLGGSDVAQEITTRVVEASEGNPLFVEQMVAMLIDDDLLRRDDGHWRVTGDLADVSVPPTINALLAARLDLLNAEERAVIEPASVIGVGFARAAVEALVPEAIGGNVNQHLDALVRKRLISPSEGDDSDPWFRFHHILVRDAAYQALLKRTRATLHERYADWADEVNRDRERTVEYDEIQGYHLEQAYGYLAELGPLDDHGRELGVRGAIRLASAGHRAFGRGDMPAAANLLRRAAALRPEHDLQRLELLPDLGEAMMEIGEFAWAEVFLEEAVNGATALSDDRLRADALLTRLLVRHHAAEDLTAWRAEVERETALLIPLLEMRDAHVELAKAWRMVAFVHATAVRWETAAAAQQQALKHARLGRDSRQEARLSSAYAYSLCDGPTPVPEAIAACEAIIAEGLVHKQSEAIVLTSLACLVALDGDFVRGRALYRQARTMLEDLGATVLAASTSFMSARVELLAGNPEPAERDLRGDYESLEAMGELFFRPSVGAMLAQALFAQGRTEEAETLALESAQLAAGDDIEVQALCRSVRGKVLARRAIFDEATRLASEAVEMIPSVEAPLMRTEALLDLSEVLVAAADAQAARESLLEARALCELKKMSVPTIRIETLLDNLSRSPTQPVL